MATFYGIMKILLKQKAQTKLSAPSSNIYKPDFAAISFIVDNFSLNVGNKANEFRRFAQHGDVNEKR